MQIWYNCKLYKIQVNKNNINIHFNIALYAPHPN